MWKYFLLYVELSTTKYAFVDRNHLDVHFTRKKNILSPYNDLLVGYLDKNVLKWKLIES